jgi:diguanylate cyclase (GGDEF)-like protein/PAS domain S-box-containing protein
MSIDPIACKLWDALPTMVLVFEVDGRLAFANRYFWSFTGLAPHAGLAAWSDALHSTDAGKLMHAVQLATSFSMQIGIRRADGTQGHIDITGLPVDGAGLSAAGGAAAAQLVVQPDEASTDPASAAAVTHVICVAHDITLGYQAERQARTQATQMRLLADNLPVLIAYYEVQGFRCVFANSAYARANGYDEYSIVGKSFADVIGPKATEFIQPMVERMLEEGVTVSYDRPSPGPNGEPRWLEVNLIPHLDELGKPFACFVLITDITKHRLSEIEVRDSEARLQTFLNASAEGIVFHRGGRILDVNPAVCRLVGYEAQELVGREIFEFVPPAYRAEIAAHLAANREVSYESAVWDREQNIVPVEFIGRTLNYNGQVTRMSIVRDLRDRQQAQERITYLAHHDVLTGLPNRARLSGLLDTMIEAARRRNLKLALLFVDLDHFKRINDSLGHEAGDELLRTTAQRLRAIVRETDVVARFASDEFVLAIPNVASQDEIEAVAQRVLEDLQRPTAFGGKQVSITPSIGVALYPNDGANAEELLMHADTAMYAAKQGGRAACRFFSAELAREAQRQFELEQELNRALRDDEFVLYFQPIWDAVSMQLVGAEALIRWQHPQRGLLGPLHFIEFAEQRRLIVPIGDWVIRETARWSRRWLDQGLPLLPVSVNLSTTQFRGQDFLPSLEQTLSQLQLPPGWLEFELTERMLMDDVEQVRSLLGAIKDKGINLSVDDFGTGYSSLVHLKQLPIDKLKIDRSFVKDLPDDRDSAAITMAILQMAHSLQIGTVAEGVETRAQLDLLVQLGCERIQGFLLGKPMPGEQLSEIIERARNGQVLPAPSGTWH